MFYDTQTPYREDDHWAGGFMFIGGGKRRSGLGGKPQGKLSGEDLGQLVSEGSDGQCGTWREGDHGRADALFQDAVNPGLGGCVQRE